MEGCSLWTSWGKGACSMFQHLPLRAKSSYSKVALGNWVLSRLGCLQQLLVCCSHGTTVKSLLGYSLFSSKFSRGWGEQHWAVRFLIAQNRGKCVGGGKLHFTFYWHLFITLLNKSTALPNSFAILIVVNGLPMFFWLRWLLVGLVVLCPMCLWTGFYSIRLQFLYNTIMKWACMWSMLALEVGYGSLQSYLC